MSRCVYCGERAGFISRVCKDCRKLVARVKKLGPSFGYRQLLDTLLESGVKPDKVERFLEADPDRTGSLNEHVTARMTNELMKDLGQPTEMKAEHVREIRERIARGESYLDEADVTAHPKAEPEDKDLK